MERMKDEKKAAGMGRWSRQEEGEKGGICERAAPDVVSPPPSPPYCCFSPSEEEEAAAAAAIAFGLVGADADEDEVEAASHFLRSFGPT